MIGAIGLPAFTHLAYSAGNEKCQFTKHNSKIFKSIRKIVFSKINLINIVKMSKLFRKKLAICWFAVQFLYFAMTTDVNRTGTY